MDWALYRRALFCAQKILLRMSASRSINGMEAHDFAMESILSASGEWSPTIVYRRIVDAIREETGYDKQKRAATRQRVRLWDHDNFVLDEHCRGIDEPILPSVFTTPQHRFVVDGLAHGLTQAEIAVRMGVSKSTVCNQVNEIRYMLLKAAAEDRNEHGQEADIGQSSGQRTDPRSATTKAAARTFGAKRNQSDRDKRRVAALVLHDRGQTAAKQQPRVSTEPAVPADDAGGRGHRGRAEVASGDARKPRVGGHMQRRGKRKRR